jgi:putative transcriptional regulator
MKREPDYEKMSVYEQVSEGLKQGIAHARGELTLKTTTLPAPAPRLSKTRVIAIRKKTGMSQSVFASFLNVPKKTLQSWEQGARSPKAGEARLLQIFDAAPAECLSLVRKAEGVRAGTASNRARRRAMSA